MSSADGWDNEALRTHLVSCWQSLKVGVGVYVRMPSGREPVFLAGHNGKPLTAADIDGAVRFLQVIKRKIESGNERA